MGRCIIIGGAEIKNYAPLKSLLHPDDFYIFCDSGLRHKEALGFEPDLIVGDFDSWNLPGYSKDQELSEESFFSDEADKAEKDFSLAAEGKKPGTDFFGTLETKNDRDQKILTLPREKYDTDTVFGVKEGLFRGFSEFLFLGVTGGRMDHTLANLYILLKLDQLGKKGVILDDYSEMELVSGKPAFVESTFSGFSLVNISGTARGVTIENAKYCLNRKEISCEYQYGVSNAVLPGKTAKITVEEGNLLLIKNR